MRRENLFLEWFERVCPRHTWPDITRRTGIHHSTLARWLDPSNQPTEAPVRLAALKLGYDDDDVVKLLRGERTVPRRTRAGISEREILEALRKLRDLEADLESLLPPDARPVVQSGGRTAP